MQAISFLLIEDDLIETMKFKRVLDGLDAKHTISLAENGEEALTLLKSNKDLPNVILLDLNMPKMNGVEFLTLLKNDAVLKYIPTIILSTSNNRKDILECYNIGIAGYIMKPLKYGEYKTKIENLVAYWSSNEFIKV